MSIQTAMILAAGRGERLRPITDRVPKPLIEVGSHRLIEYHLLALASAGIRRIVINTAHLGELVEETLGDGSRYQVNIHYSREPEGALETAGGIRHALPLLGDSPFIVINGDVRTDFEFSTLRLDDEMAMHLVLVPNPPHHPGGDFSLERSHSPARLVSGTDLPTLTFAGIGVYRPEVFHDLPQGRQALAPLIRQHMRAASVSGEEYRGYWLDVGDGERLQQARQDAVS